MYHWADKSIEVLDVYLHLLRGFIREVIFSEFCVAWYKLFLYPYLHPLGFLALIITLCFEEIWSWGQWILSFPRRQIHWAKLRRARTFREWQAHAGALDKIYGFDKWRNKPGDPLYNSDNIAERLWKLRRWEEIDDPRRVCNTIRSGLIRNMVNIAVPDLYHQAIAGTKLLIEEYAAQQVLSIRYIMNLETSPPHQTGFSTQNKLDFIRGARQTIGRSTLLLQGGSMFGLCHIGVAKALFLEGILPRVITGTSTGAYIAALLCVMTDEELGPFLNGDDWNLKTFEHYRKRSRFGLRDFLYPEKGYGWLQSIFRRLVRHVNERYLQDHDIMREFVRISLGNMTFEEAYERTNRALNITISMPRRKGVKNLMNYLTTPHVLIWSACEASNTSFAARERVKMLCKDETGQIVPYKPVDDLDIKSWHTFCDHPKASPLRGIQYIFNVNHFLISQARPFLIPLFPNVIHRPGYNGQRSRFVRLLDFLALVDTRCHLQQWDALYGLPDVCRRVLIEEAIPGSCVALLPDLSIWDASKLWKDPTKETLKHWILKGERGVWPSMASLKVRCALEFELERSYEKMKGTKDNNLLTW